MKNHFWNDPQTGISTVVGLLTEGFEIAAIYNISTYNNHLYMCF